MAVIRIPVGDRRIDTGRRRLSAILGDGVLTGCNSVLHPGVVVGRETQIYPEKSIIKLQQTLEVVPQS